MAVIAAADAVTDLRTTLGVRRRDLWDRIQLYTFGQVRRGAGGAAARSLHSLSPFDTT